MFTDFADKARSVIHSSVAPADITVKTDDSDASTATKMWTEPTTPDNSGYQALTSSQESEVEFTTVDPSENGDQTTTVQGKL